MNAHPNQKALVVLTLLAALLLVLPPPAALAQKGETSTRTLHGQVVDKGGNPLAKAVVYLKNTKTLQMRTYIADDGGAFHFQGLAPNVDYEVHAEHDGASSPVKVISGFDSRKEINISLKIDKK